MAAHVQVCDLSRVGQPPERVGHDYVHRADGPVGHLDQLGYRFRVVT